MLEGQNLIRGKSTILSTMARQTMGPAKVMLLGGDSNYPHLSTTEVKSSGAIPPIPHMPTWRGA
jgi:hypothetical protein